MPGRGTTKRVIRMGDGLWELLGQAARRAGTDRAAAIRAWALWYAGITDELPDRPEPPATD